MYANVSWYNVLDSNVKCGDNRHRVDNPAKFPYKKYRENIYIIKSNNLQLVKQKVFLSTVLHLIVSHVNIVNLILISS